jgi:hypothetical protein
VAVPSTILFGAHVEEEVDEPNCSGPVVIFELPAYPEPKSLIPAELRALYVTYRSYYRVAEVIGASEGFALQNMAKNRD